MTEPRDTEHCDRPEPFKPPPTLGCRWAVGTRDADGFVWRKWCVLVHGHDGPHQHMNGMTFMPQ